MPTLEPKIAAQLASEVYFVQNETQLPFFLERPEFSRNKALLKANVGGRIFRAAKDAFGICASGGTAYNNELFLIFRGSTGANRNADWISNGRIGVQFSTNGLPVHIGFNSIFHSMLPDIKAFLKDFPDIHTIHCVGHSLGGAVATLAADWIRSYRKKTVKLYTFGAPKAGLMLFAGNLTRKLGSRNIHRVYHATDPVSMIPLFPFVHAPLPGYGHYIASDEGITTAAAHDRKKYVKTASKANDWALLQRRSPPFTAETVIENWLQSKLPVHASSPVVWDWINAALIYVLKKILGAALVGVQASLMGLHSIADLIAWALHRGIFEPVRAAKKWVSLLIQKMMQALGWKVFDKDEDLTHGLMKNVLVKVMEKTNEEARKAVRQIR